MQLPLAVRVLSVSAAAQLLVVGATCAQSPSPAASATPMSAVEATPTPSPTATPVRKEILDKYDANHNGVLDPDEKAAFERDHSQRHIEKLRKYDKNGDGVIDEKERAAMQADHEKAKASPKASATP